MSSWPPVVPRGKIARGDGDVALEHAGEAVAQLGARPADADRAGDVGGAVLVLAAAVDEEQPAADRQVRRLADPVMGDRRVRAGGGDGGKGHVLQRAGVAAERLQRRGRVDLGQPAVRRLGVEPGEKARQRRAVANMRGARSGEFDRVLDRLHPRDRVGLDDRLAARRLERLDQPRRRGRRVEDDARARRAARRDERDERLRRRDSAKRPSRAPIASVSFRASTNKVGRPSRGA